MKKDSPYSYYEDEVLALLKEHKGSHDSSTNYTLIGVADLEDLSHTMGIAVEGKQIHDGSYTQCEFIGLNFSNCLFSFIHFLNCKFLNCKFRDCYFENVYFTDSFFLTCEIENTKFSGATLVGAKFTSCFFVSDLIENTNFYESSILSSTVSNLEFNDCSITVDFDGIISAETGIGIMFKDSHINGCNFRHTDLKNSFFINNTLVGSSFITSPLSTKTFDENNRQGHMSNVIDFQTIVQSDKIPGSVLKRHFNIHSDDIKEYVKEMVTEFEFQSVFISFSFNDYEFAQRLNQALRSHGVMTFFWKLDAEGGNTLKDIMKDNVKKKDRLLFIASEHSIKSQACQFELTQGRKKQEESWEKVFFPIHIDNYLFKLEKDTIKPQRLQEEYWENIQEIIKFNSLDFSEFTKSDYNKGEFDDMVKKLVKSLRKKEDVNIAQ